MQQQLLRLRIWLGMVDFLKDEQLRRIQNGELWGSNTIQTLVLECLEEVGMFRNKISRLFRDSRKNAEDQNRWESVTRYDRMSENYAG